MMGEALKKKIEERVEAHRLDMIHTLSDLIEIPTSNPPGRAYKQCVDYLSGLLKKWNISHRIVQASGEKHTGDEFPRFFIVGEWGKGEKCLHYHGHYDVVPVQNENQFKSFQTGSLICGRGSADMKGGLTSLLYALRVIQKIGFKELGKITFSLVPDEETGGGLGTRYLVEKKFLPKGIMGMLMPEPTSRVIWNANKGALTYRIFLRGRSAHAALESQGENAFKYLIDIAQSLFSLREMIKRRKTKIPVSPPDANRSSLLIGGQTGSGASFNVVPEHAFFTIDRRINPEESLDEAKKEIEAVLDDYRKKGVSLKAEIIQEGESSFADPESELALVLKQSIEEVTSETARFELCPGLCEIRFFNRLGIPSYAYGPGLLEAAHSPNECVDINKVLECAVICTLTAYKFLGD